MRVVGLTGGIASGKSVVSKMITELGFNVIDSDIIARELLEKDSKVISEVKYAFPEAIKKETQVADRQLLGQIIFNNPKRRQQLNDIIHPRVKQIILNKIANSQNELIFIDVPLLYEANFVDICDYVIVVYVSHQTQVDRLIARDQITREYAQTKISSQMSLEEKKKLADFVIDNNGSVVETQHQLLAIIKALKERK